MQYPVEALPNPCSEKKLLVTEDTIAQDTIRRRVIPQPLFSQPIDEALFLVVTLLCRPLCRDLDEFVSRNLSASPPTGPALLIPLLDLSSTVSTLEPRCESLVANISCARGTLQVRELCIKAVRKAKRV
jgi:hypothetical protein